MTTNNIKILQYNYEKLIKYKYIFDKNIFNDLIYKKGHEINAYILNYNANNLLSILQNLEILKSEDINILKHMYPIIIKQLSEKIISLTTWKYIGNPIYINILNANYCKTNYYKKLINPSKYQNKIEYLKSLQFMLIYFCNIGYSSYINKVYKIKNENLEFLNIVRSIEKLINKIALFYNLNDSYDLKKIIKIVNKRYYLLQLTNIKLINMENILNRSKMLLEPKYIKINIFFKNEI